MATEYEIKLPDTPIADPFMVRLRRKAKRMAGITVPVASAFGWPSMPYPTAELVYWRPAGGVNFGDELSRAIVQLMLARKGLTIYDEIPAARRMLAIGSIVHFASDNSVIWGSGVNGSVAEASHAYKTLDIRAVRGPITRSFLLKRGIEVPEVYGDPGLLVKVLTGDRFGQNKRSKVGVVPHMSDLKRPEVQRLQGARDTMIIDPHRSWNIVIDEIASCEFVVSSSLHGLIVADAFGIPAIYVRLGEHEGLLKYEDYYAGTSRELQYVTSLDEALNHKGSDPLSYDTTRLLEAFPYDIWLGDGN